MKILASILALLLLLGCSAKNEPAAPTAAPAAPVRLWTHDDAPTGLTYQRAWIYSAAAETEDPETLAALVDAIRALRVGEQTAMVTEDFTDVLVFTFADGETLRLCFENRCVLSDDGTRREVEGLDRVRTILDGLVAETGE